MLRSFGLYRTGAFRKLGMPVKRALAAHRFTLVVGVIVMAAVAVLVGLWVVRPSTMAPAGTRSWPLYVQVISDSTGEPVAGLRVRASALPSADTYAIAPSAGPVPPECVVAVPSGSAVLGDGMVLLPNGSTVTYPTCKIDVYLTNSTGGVRIEALAVDYCLIVVEYPASPQGTCRGGCAWDVVEVHSRPIAYVTVTIPSGNFTVNTGDEGRTRVLG